MNGKKPELLESLVNPAILDPMPGPSKTQDLAKAMCRESISATTDLIKSTPENIRKSWGISAKDPVTSEYLAGIERIYSLPGTIEDEMPPVSQAFADKVKAMGGIMTPYGLICDPTVPVEGKRYMRLAKAFFCLLSNRIERHVEDVEFRIRNYVQRNKEATDWEGMTAHFVKGLRLVIKHRHQPGLRKPIYASTVTVPSGHLTLLEKADFSIDPTLKE